MHSDAVSRRKGIVSVDHGKGEQLIMIDFFVKKKVLSKPNVEGYFSSSTLSRLGEGEEERMYRDERVGLSIGE